jgi:hypothetical protein
MKRGFTMFFAVLVAGLTLSIGVAIYDLVTRELALSQTTAESQYAIYMADTGSECALYWDSKCSSGICTNQSGTAFATSSTSRTPTSNVICNGFDIAANGTPPVGAFQPQSPSTWTAWDVTRTDATAATTTFEFMLPVTDSVSGTTMYRCAHVTVAKYVDTAPRTLITSDGYSNCDLNSLNLTERELQLNY